MNVLRVEIDVNQQDAAAGYAYLIESLDRVLENIPITKLYNANVDKDFVLVLMPTTSKGQTPEFATLLEATLGNEVLFLV
jgi:predicted RNA binding protein with dsRBD fold (UPF0201 family)